MQRKNGNNCAKCGEHPRIERYNYCRLCKRALDREYMRTRRAEKSDYDRGYRRENTDKLRAQAREYNQRIRQEALNHYGGQCACCGENKREFLAIDHINGGGQKHRKSMTISIYRWLRKNDFPEGFRVLCHNCNSALGFYGYCPHGKEV